MKGLVGVVLALVMGAAVSRGESTYCVATNGSDSNSGLSWSVPLKTVAAALAKTVDGDTVLVSNGTYAVSAGLLITNAVQLAGLSGDRGAVIDAPRAWWRTAPWRATPSMAP